MLPKFHVVVHQLIDAGLRPFRQVMIEEKRLPLHVELHPFRGIRRDRPVKPALPDKAPWSYGVGNNGYLDQLL